MKSAVLYILLFLTVITAAAQRTSITDSLERRLASSKADTNRVMLLKSLALFSHRANPDTAMRLLQEALLLAKRLRFEKGKAECLLTQGVILEQKGRYPQALEVLLQSKSISEHVNDINLISRILRAMGKLYASQGDYAQAMAYLFEAKSIQEKIQAKSTLANTLKIIGEVYFKKNLLDSSLLFLNQSYEMLENKNDVGLDDLFKDLGQVQAAMGNDAEAMRYFRSSVSIADNDQTILNEAYLGIARLFQTSGGADSSIYYSRKALEAAQEINYSKGILAAAQLLSEVYAPINEHAAFHYYKMATAVKDSLFNAEKAKQVQNLGFVEQQRLQSIEANRREYKNRVKVYALLFAVGVFLLLALFLWRNNRYKQKAKIKVEKAYDELKAAQAQLVQREKMASLGELTVGIAHEIQNPLNFVNNFSEINRELIDELKEEQKKEIRDLENENRILDEIKQNEQKINHHGKRADAIVKGMLQHSRISAGKKDSTDINALADEYLRLSYHGLRAKDKDFNADFKTYFDKSIGEIKVVPEDIGRVLLNLYNNAFYEVSKKKNQQNGMYEPIVEVSTQRVGDKVEISVKDNGLGIPQKVLDKIYQPFFTTKPPGQGTGLGLSLSYDIVKAHGGEIKVESNEGEGATFIVELPLT